MFVVTLGAPGDMARKVFYALADAAAYYNQQKGDASLLNSVGYEVLRLRVNGREYAVGDAVSITERYADPYDVFDNYVITKLDDIGRQCLITPSDTTKGLPETWIDLEGVEKRFVWGNLIGKLKFVWEFEKGEMFRIGEMRYEVADMREVNALDLVEITCTNGEKIRLPFDAKLEEIPK